MTDIVKERLAKRIAASGLCSRRDAERLIEAGRVTVAGKLVTTPAFTVTAHDAVTVNGNLLPTVSKNPRVFILNKPVGIICTAKDEKGRKTVFDILPGHLPHLILVGRLDYNSEGLLLLTTDGGLAQKLMRPQTGLSRTYKVRFKGKLTADITQKLATGLTIDGVHYRPIVATPTPGKEAGSNNWATFTLTEGKNREIRKVLEHFGLQVSRLLRTDYGPFTLGQTRRGAISEVPWYKVRQLLEELDKTTDKGNG